VYIAKLDVYALPVQTWVIVAAWTVEDQTHQTLMNLLRSASSASRTRTFIIYTAVNL